MKYSLIFIFVLAIISSAFAEEAPVQHKITFERGLFTNTYTVDGRDSDVDEVENLLLYVPDASAKWETGNTIRHISWGLAFTGGFFIGYGIYDSSTDRLHGTFEGGRGMIIYLGGFAIIAGFILERIGNSKKDTAIEIYNSENGKKSSIPTFGHEDEFKDNQSSFNIEIAPTPLGGVGLAFNF